jgi:hypothetical protein
MEGEHDMSRFAALALSGALLGAACAEGPTEPGSDLAAALGRGPAAATTAATIYVVHGINGTDLGASEALPVDVSLNGACALTGFTFRTITPAITLPAGSYDIQVRLADAGNPCTGPVAINAPGVVVPAGINASVVAHLTAAGAPTASVFVNDVSRVPGQSRLMARHTAQFGLVDILLDGTVAFAGVPNGVQGTSGPIRPGEHEVAIAVAGTSTRAFEATLELRPFTGYAAYAVGTPGNGTFEVLLQAIPLPVTPR